MSILSGSARLLGGVLVEVDDPALSVEEAAGRVKFVFEDKLGMLWPDSLSKLSYALAPNVLGQTRWIAVYGLDASSPIMRQVCEGQGCQAFIDMLDRVCQAAEQLLKRPPAEEAAPAPTNGVGPEASPKLAEQRRDAGSPRAG